MGILRTGSAGNDIFSNRGHNNAIAFNPGDRLAGGAGDDQYILYFPDYMYNDGPLPTPPVTIVEAADGGWDIIGFAYLPGALRGLEDPFVPQTYHMPQGIEEASHGEGASVYPTIVGNGLGNHIRIRGKEERQHFATAHGAAGNDLLTGELGKLRLTGGDGDDLLHLRLNPTGGWEMEAEAFGSIGRDMLIIASTHAHAGIAFSLAAQGTTQTLLPGRTVLATGIEDLWVSDNGQALAGGRNDTLTGTALDNMIIATGGADSVNGGDGNDLLFGDGTSDMGIIANPVFDLSFVQGAYTFSQSESWADTLLGANGGDTLVGGAGGDLLLGGDGDDLLVGHHLPRNPDLTTRYYSLEQLDAYLADAGAADTLRGGSGADTLDGGGGGDQMQGEAGDDTYLVNLAGDRTIERAGQGFDTVLSHLAATRLAAHLEVLILLEGAGRGTGNDEANRITGNAGANRLDGGAGADTLVGGAGHDTLIGGEGADVIQLATPDEGVDAVVGFVSGSDRLFVSASGFGGGLLAGGTAEGRFFAATLPRGTPDGAFAYEELTGRLWWDANGSAPGDRTLLLTLGAGTMLAATDLLLIA